MQQWTSLQRDLDGLINNKRPKDERIWLPLDDEDLDGEWVDFYNRKVVNFSLPWSPGEPNGGTSENCVGLSPPIRLLFDYACNSPNYAFACMCERTPAPYLRLWGLCYNSDVQDTLYQPVNNLTDLTKLTLVSFRTLIRFDVKDMTWVMTDAESNVTATSKSRSPLNSFTLGRHNWTIKGDTGCSESGWLQYVTELKMSGCYEGNFTCNDGQCVSMDQRAVLYYRS